MLRLDLLRWTFAMSLLIACDKAPPGRATPMTTLNTAGPADVSSAQAPIASVAREPTPVEPTAVELRGAHELTWSFGEMPLGPAVVVVSVPARADATQRFPVLVALHGRGEASKQPQAGARGWLDDYYMNRALTRLEQPPLTSDDFQGMVDAERLSRINQSLKRRPYRGLVVVCPYLPDRFKGERAFEEAPALASYLTETVLPRVYAETPALSDSRSTALDGVSLGGRAALMAGALAASSFGALGALQPALDQSELTQVSRWLERAKQHRPSLLLRLITSDQDYFLRETQALSRKLDAAAVSHHLDILRGNHSYEFNRGPGVFEMLLYYDRVLRSEPYL